MEFPPKIYSSTPFHFLSRLHFRFVRMKPKLARTEIYNYIYTHVFQTSIGEVHFGKGVRTRVG